MPNFCLFSNDVETHSIWFNKLSDRTGHLLWKEAIPFLLDIYEQRNIRATFFFTGYIAKLIPEMVRCVNDKGHEIACHGLVHDVDKAFDVLSYKEQVRHLKEAKALLEEIAGTEVISFRAPALRVNKCTPLALAESGFKIDSSISPQRIDMLLSFGSFHKFQRLLSPRYPYYTKHDNLAKKGDGPIIEIPLSSFILPFVGSTLRVFPNVNRLLRAFLTYEAKSRDKPIVFYMHPSELIDEKTDKVVPARRVKNVFKYVLSDVIRRQLKIRNLGLIAHKLYTEQVEYFNNKGFTFVTTQEYCKLKGLYV